MNWTTLIDMYVFVCVSYVFFLQETVSNAPPLAWPWNVSSQIATVATSTTTATTTTSESTNAPTLTLSKSCILSENKANSSISSSSNNSRNKRNHTSDSVGTTLNKRNRSSNSNGKDCIHSFSQLNHTSI